MPEPKVTIGTNDLEMGSLQFEKHDKAQCNNPIFLPGTYYTEVVEPKMQQRPWLQSLHQFMDPSTEGFGMSLFKRMNHFDIKVIPVPKAGKANSVIPCRTPDDLEKALSEDGNIIGALVIAKGLSRAMIESLGTRFGLEPEFFASHLAGTEIFRTGYFETRITRQPARTLTLLPDYIRKSPFYTTEYRRPYHIEGGTDTLCNLRITETSTPRSMHVLHRDYPDIWGTEKISVYKQRGSNFGIILTDQLLSTAPPASCMSIPLASLGDECNDTCGSQVSSRRELISWLQCLTPDEASRLLDDHEQLALKPVLRIVETNSVMFLAHTRHIVRRIRMRNCDTQFPDSIPFFLRTSSGLYHALCEEQKILHRALHIASLRGCDGIADQKQYFQFQADDVDRTLKTLKEHLRFLVGESSIQEGKMVGLVSKFAAVFLPVSLLATILTINGAGYTRWAILGGLSVPFGLISIYFMFIWKPAYLGSLGP